ncbi:filamentous hemagglutinin N-terminal domain-containing protein, partial [Leptospira sp. SA-E8]|uniref:filamentous hemagglutinin N-terminal domain-containing protein n=1 Tax=Leptospira sp. SA-E8 TaxID=3422259 RepID=UPI003EB92470
MKRASGGVSVLPTPGREAVASRALNHRHPGEPDSRIDRRLGFSAAQRKRIAAGVLLAYLFYPGVVVAQSAASGGGAGGVEAAAGSAHAPQITQSQNNIQVVNINKASSAGVSRNQYNQFNVGPQGLILNNSTGIVQTQLGGYIDGNAALKGQSARIILNEVVSANPSQLRGYTEIAGQRAEFILANPNGISCNGCGFINTTRSTLTTGTTQFKSDGSIGGFRVEGGQIAIEGLGLNASNVDQLDLLSRTIRINGELWAKQLNLVTGRNTVDRATLAATPLPDASGTTQTGIALDVAAIGGMYANVIRMVGTEKGFGVNNQGQMIAEKDFM